MATAQSSSTTSTRNTSALTDLFAFSGDLRNSTLGRLTELGCTNLRRLADRNLTYVQELAKVRDLSGLFEHQQKFLRTLFKDQETALKDAVQIVREGFGAAKSPSKTEDNPRAAPQTSHPPVSKPIPTAAESPRPPAPSVPKSAKAMFELYRDQGDAYRFRLKGADGRVLLTSHAYKTRTGALQGVDSARKNAANDAHYVEDTSSSGKPVFSLKAGNNRVIGTSVTFASAKDMKAAIGVVRRVAAHAEVNDTD